MKGGNDAMDEE